MASLFTFKQCSSCGALHNKSCACSKGGFVGKFVRDPNKTPESSQRPPHNCPNCGDPVDGLYCRQCALLRKKLREIFDENEFFQDLLNHFESSNNKTNVVNLPQEPFVFNQDPDENSSQSPPHIDHHCCYECVSIISNLEPCNNQTIDELPQSLPSFDPTCDSRDSFTYDSNLNFVDDSSNRPPPPPTYSYEFCRDDAYYGLDYPPQVLFIYNPEPSYNQDFNFPQNFQSFQKQYICCTRCGGPHETFQCQQVIFYEPYCENCGGPHETFQCQPMNYYEPNPCYDSNYFRFDQFEPPQHLVIHQPIREKTCAELLAEERAANINQPPQETSLEFLQDNRNLINSVKTFLGKFRRSSFYETPKVISLAWETILEIEHAFEDKQYQPEGILELFHKLHNDVQNIHEELAEYINTQSWNRPIVYYDDDDEDYNIVITPILSTEEPVNSLIMEDKHLDTIPAMESDKVIKSSVEILVPIPSESN
ncbi:hypothetical protein Tco_0073637 [Tanacetum coccineum]